MYDYTITGRIDADGEAVIGTVVRDGGPQIIPSPGWRAVQVEAWTWDEAEIKAAAILRGDDED